MKRCEVSDWTEADFWVPGEIEVYLPGQPVPVPVVQRLRGPRCKRFGKDSWAHIILCNGHTRLGSRFDQTHSINLLILKYTSN